jgi:hypothetical protein
MPDIHLRILTAAARHDRRQLAAHDHRASARPGTVAMRRRIDLASRASRTRSRVAAARARRNLPPDTRAI